MFTKDEAKAHDAIVAEAYGALHRAQDALDAAYDEGHRAAGDRRQRIGKRYGDWTMDRAPMLAKLRSLTAGEYVSPTRRRADDAYRAISNARTAVDDHRAHVQALEQVRDDNGRWQRFYLVMGGHIHASTSCHTLRPTTRVGWLPDLSGETEAEAVAAHGPLLCTVCFPSAPVEWTCGLPEADDTCPGSLTWDYDRATARLGYCSGNYGRCSHCGENVTVTSAGKLRKHKKENAA